MTNRVFSVSFFQGPLTFPGSTLLFTDDGAYRYVLREIIVYGATGGTWPTPANGFQIQSSTSLVQLLASVYPNCILPNTYQWNGRYVTTPAEEITATALNANLYCAMSGYALSLP